MLVRSLGAAFVFAIALASSPPIPLAFADAQLSAQTANLSATASTHISLTDETVNPIGPVVDNEVGSKLSAALPLTSTDAEKRPKTFGEMKAEYIAEKTQAANADAERAFFERSTKELAYDPALIAAIGNQRSSGHSICCPGFACAYGDAILTGIANDHSTYGCGQCTWPNWGGGNSSFRSLGSNEALLREAYDQIASGKPTVIHVAGPYGEHWITLIGYHEAADPDNLTLSNFTALDPADGAVIDPSGKYVLYGDFCEHISSR